MAWTAPLTASTGELTSAEWNEQIRDNLNESLPAKSTDPRDELGNPIGSMFFVDGSNSLAERAIAEQRVWSQVFINDTSYVSSGDLIGDSYSTGPSILTWVDSNALVIFSVEAQSSEEQDAAFASIEVSGASSVSADDDWAIRIQGLDPANSSRVSSAHLFTGLSTGWNRFTMAYKVSGGSGLSSTFRNRSLIVWPM